MKPLTIGVAGGTGSGKTTVSNAIIEAAGVHNVALLPQDAYYRDYSHLPLEDHALINWDHPDAIETGLLVRQLRELVSGCTIARPRYDFKTDSRLPDAQYVAPRPVIIVEGILILVERELRDLLDIKVFVDTDADIRFIRRLRRDVEERGRTISSIIEQYVATVRPMHLEFVEPSKRYADLIIPEGGFNRVAIDMLVKSVNAALQAVSA
jgi:uridine kinase